MTRAGETAANIAISMLQASCEGRPGGPMRPPAGLEMVMRTSLAIAGKRPRARAIVREAATALLKAWAAHSVKRTIADVASTSDRDYRAFGLDKAELLAALEGLRGDVEGGRTFTTLAAGCRADGPRLTFTVTRRKPTRPTSR